MTQKIPERRIDNLDLIRASAITVVVLFHTSQMLGGENFIGFMYKFVQVGKYGVDLFFVLSGFLIGRLYWNELLDSGTVNVARFILRRIFRTYLPYLMALFLSFGAIWISKHQSFDLGYLFFAQNYYNQMPFFLVSWSLCVEEHFYVLLPLILIFTQKVKPQKVLLILSILSFIPLLLRFSLIEYDDLHAFGYYITATHFRFEGLILGVAASHVFTYSPKISKLIGNIYFNNGIIFSVFFMVIVLPFVNDKFIYYIGLSIIALSFCALVLSFATRYPFAIAQNPVVKLLAISSYSIYLTHALVIHIVLIMSKKLGLNHFLTWLTMIAMIFIIGHTFYILVEKKSLVLRDKLVPKLQKKANVV
jgi:peptidoglycan/LPS O-acetylase OafA/YrhL